MTWVSDSRSPKEALEPQHADTQGLFTEVLTNATSAWPNEESGPGVHDRRGSGQTDAALFAREAL